MTRIHLLVFGLILLLMSPTAAQTAAPSANPSLTTAHDQAFLYRGPGDTFRQAGVLNPGVEVSIIERNTIGNWLHIIRLADGKIADDGWVSTAYLNLDPQLHFSDVPVNTEIADADPTNTDSKSLSALYSVPVIPKISDKMREAYQFGQTLGNNPHSITKVGDSLSANGLYLKLMSQDNNELGPYDYLQDTLAYFGKSTAVNSVAARIGMTSYVIFDPMWANKDVCVPKETPLDCEYRLKKPIIAFIMFGPNDVKHMKAEQFEKQMRQLVEATVAKGIIPVVSTFSYNPEAELWPQAVAFNLALVKIAADEQTPLVNLWLAARPLPQYGLDGDDIHLKNSGFRFLNYTGGQESHYGVALQNLLALRTLDEIRRTLDLK